MKPIISKHLQEIDQLKNHLMSLPSLNEGEMRKIRELFIVENTYNSNAIEGSTLSLYETSLVIVEGLTIDKKPLRDHLDAIGHKEAFEYVFDVASDKEPLTERTIKEIHSLVLATDRHNRGKYRVTDVGITGTDYKPPGFPMLQEMMRDLLQSYHNDKRHDVEKIADFHVHFERIHPFSDGNGRTGRLVLNLELIKHDLPPIDIKFTDRGRYIGCLKDFEETNSTDGFVVLVAENVISELKKHIDLSTQKLKALSDVPQEQESEKISNRINQIKAKYIKHQEAPNNSPKKPKKDKNFER